MNKELFPIELSEENIFKTLYSLQNSYSEAYGDIIHTKEDIPVKQIGQALSEFIDLVKLTSSEEDKKYILRRLLALKSASRLLEEIASYLPIKFNYEIDSNTGTPKTLYTPRLLKVAIKTLTITNLSSDFLKVIDTMFTNLLYYINYSRTVEDLIYSFGVDLEETTFKSSITPAINIDLTTDYYIT